MSDDLDTLVSEYFMILEKLYRDIWYVLSNERSEIPEGKWKHQEWMRMTIYLEECIWIEVVTVSM
jgi:hypothetical protein